MCKVLLPFVILQRTSLILFGESKMTFSNPYCRMNKYTVVISASISMIPTSLSHNSLALPWKTVAATPSIHVSTFFLTPNVLPSPHYQVLFLEQMCIVHYIQWLFIPTWCLTYQHSFHSKDNLTYLSLYGIVMALYIPWSSIINIIKNINVG